MSRRKKEPVAEAVIESESQTLADATAPSTELQAPIEAIFESGELQALVEAIAESSELQAPVDAMAEIPVDTAPIVDVGTADAASATDPDDDATDADGGLWPLDRLKSVIEAVVFAAADPTSIRRLREVVEGATAPEIKAALLALQEDYAARGVRLAEVAGGWQLRSAPEHQEVVKKLFKEKPFRLTRAGMETLAVIAYRQPATRAEVESIRGVDASAVLESLVERRLVRIAGRRDVPGRPLVYVTSQEFLETFGLKDLKSLPTLPELGDDIRAMAEQSAFTEGDDRNAPILPLEEGEATSGHEERAARTVERAGQADQQQQEDDQGAASRPAQQPSEAEA